MTSSSHQRILLAEDNSKDLALALAALAEHRLTDRVVVARDGTEALDYLHRRGRFAGHTDDLPAVALLDLKMPKMDGLEVLRHIRTDPALHRIPVVMLTSSREERDLSRCYQLGVNAYVVKPVDFHCYVAWVKSLGQFWAIINEPPPFARGAPASP